MTGAAALLLAAVSARAQTTDLVAPLPTITTTGEATVSRPPDVAYVTLGAETRAGSPREAQRLNAEAMTNVQKQLSDAGIRRDAVRTLGLSLDQEFDVTSGRRVPRGYVARNIVEVRIDEVARAGDVIDLVVKGGATSLQGVRFDLKDRAAAERDALEQAVVDARRRADAAAAGVGRMVDRILKVDDVRDERVVVPRVMAMRADATGGASTPVEPGLIEIRAKATLTVSMK